MAGVSTLFTEWRYLTVCEKYFDLNLRASILFRNFAQILNENGEISKNFQVIIKRSVAILDNIVLHNLTKI